MRPNLVNQNLTVQQPTVKELIVAIKNNRFKVVKIKTILEVEPIEVDQNNLLTLLQKYARVNGAQSKLRCYGNNKKRKLIIDKELNNI